MTVAVIFPGQGSQAVGMGEGLFNKFPEYVEEASDALGFDISDLCIRGPKRALDNTENTQVAIYLVNALHYYEWQRDKPAPNFVLGHSIGEYNAMLAADMISFSEGLALVKRRGELMAKQHGGAMAAVMKISGQELLNALGSVPGGDLVDIANYNSEYQTVISSTEPVIEQITQPLQDLGAFVVRLNTSGAFHSRYMAQAKTSYSELLQRTTFSPAKIPLICNTTAGAPTDPRVALAQHLVSPVKWYQSIYRILDSDRETDFVECGWGKTLSNILRFNRKEYKSSIGSLEPELR